MLQFRLKPRRTLLVLICLALTLTFTFNLLRVEAQDPQNDSTVFLPIIVKSNTTSSPPPVPTTAGALFADTQWKTASNSIAVDAAGGMHLAYYYYEPASGQAPTSAVYLYCPAQCDQAANWNGVSMGNLVNEVQLKLTPAGQPRLLFRATSQVQAGGNDYFYAECNQNCLDPNQWGLTYILTSFGTSIFDVNDDTLPQRYFDLDPQGHPRFLYLDRNYPIEPDHYGAYYVTCESDCTQEANWSQTLISEVIQQPFNWEVFEYMALTFTQQGQPRFVANVIPLNGDPAIYYFECNTNCNERLNWSRVLVSERGGGSDLSWDIALDANDRPRLAVYPAATLNNTGERLYYLWCNADCLNEASWQRRDLGLGTKNGQEPDLELDAQGRPRLAYAYDTSNVLGYSWCDTNCESPGAQWQHQVIESATTLEQAWPGAYPIACNPGLWHGLTPTLALDGAGNPRIGYDTTYHAYCLYQDPTRPQDPPYYRFELVVRAVRAVFFPQP